MFVCGALLAGLFGGAPMRPDEIEKLMFQLHSQKQEQVIKKDDDDGS